MFPLESPRRGDFNEYTQYTIFNIKKKENHPKLSQICSYGIFPRDSRNEFETAVVNESSVFESLKFYCMSGALLHLQTAKIQFSPFFKVYAVW